MNYLLLNKKRIAVFSGAVLLSLSIFAATLSNYVPVSVASKSSSTITDCGATPPADSSWVYGPLGGVFQPAITSDIAIQNATEWAGTQVDNSTQIVANLVSFTNNNYYSGDPDSDPNAYLLHENIPAYVISFCNVSYMVHSGPPRTRGTHVSPISVHEINVVVDATTGNPIERFYYR